MLLTDKQTNKCHQKHNLIVGDEKWNSVILVMVVGYQFLCVMFSISILGGLGLSEADFNALRYFSGFFYSTHFRYPLGNLPVERSKDAVCFLQQCGVSLVSSYAVCFLQRGGVSLASSAIIYNIVKVSRWAVDPLTPSAFCSGVACTTAKGAELDSAAWQAKGAVAAVWCEAGPYII